MNLKKSDFGIFTDPLIDKIKLSSIMGGVGTGGTGIIVHGTGEYLGATTKDFLRESDGAIACGISDNPPPMSTWDWVIP